MGKYLDMLLELEAGKKSDMPTSLPDITDISNKSVLSGGHLGVSENTKMAVITSETKPKPPTEPATRVTKVYHVIVDTGGVHKGMTIIDPTGEDLEGFRQSCCNRFGAERVISIKERT